MKFHIITLPFDLGKGEFDTRELDAFCAQTRILSYQTTFIQINHQAFWSILLCYEPIALPKKSKKVHSDTPSDFNEQQLICLADLKHWRNQLAQQAGHPPYIIASNALLEEMVRQNALTISSLLNLTGFGKKKATKYGQDIINIIKKHQQS